MPTPQNSLLALCRGVAALALSATLPSPGHAAPPPYPWPETPPPFQPVTRERVAALPAVERPAWLAYLAESDRRAALAPSREAFATPSLQRLEGAGIPSKHSRGLQLRAPAAWYATTEARLVADRVVEYQSAAGGWTKGNDYTQPFARKTAEADVWSGGTFDNDATVWELRFLAKVAAAAPDGPPRQAWREAFLRGLDYVLAAQYPNGGFPQIYPLAGGYHDAITFNDDAMVQALELLREVGDGRGEFALVPAAVRTRAAARVEPGLRCILAAQLRDATGRRTVWCQQHDALTLRPCAARNFEPAAACTNESAALVRHLLSLEAPPPDAVAAVHGAVAWLNRTVLHGVAWTRQGGAGRLVPREGAAPLWARMYELGTDRPVFGDRDRTVHFDVNELSSERRNGYAWFGNWPAAVLADYPVWTARRP